MRESRKRWGDASNLRENGGIVLAELSAEIDFEIGEHRSIRAHTEKLDAGSFDEGFERGLLCALKMIYDQTAKHGPSERSERRANDQVKKGS